jgi:hypothetical protein
MDSKIKDRGDRRRRIMGGWTKKDDPEITYIAVGACMSRVQAFFPSLLEAKEVSAWLLCRAYLVLG